MNTIQIISIIVIILGIIIYLFSKSYNKIKTLILKINSVESEIDSSLRNKYDLLSKLISEIEKDNKNEKRFKDFDKLKDEKLSSFEFDRDLQNIENIIFTIKNDNSKLQKNNSFNDTWYQVININTKIKANVKFYNDNIYEYNLLISKIPSKIISIIFKYKEKKYFDEKNMYDKNTKDFKI